MVYIPSIIFSSPPLAASKFLFSERRLELLTLQRSVVQAIAAEEEEERRVEMLVAIQPIAPYA